MTVIHNFQMGFTRCKGSTEIMSRECHQNQLLLKYYSTEGNTTQYTWYNSSWTPNRLRRFWNTSGQYSLNLKLSGIWDLVEITTDTVVRTLMKNK